jgi:hypothetical protein
LVSEHWNSAGTALVLAALLASVAAVVVLS